MTSATRTNIVRSATISLLVFLCGCYEPPTLAPNETCHPSDPACASLDFDEDGVPNGRDEFPLDPRCSEESDDHCGACDRSCASNFTCQDSKCVPIETERCDGQDNDLDQVVDEGLSPPSATLSRGVCEGLTRRCAGADGWIDPDTEAVSHYEPDEVSCDGLDNDCDGQVDELLSAPLATPQRGVCQGSLLTCEGELGWLDPDRRVVIELYEASELSCDGLDNDCDGQTDERVDGEPCQTDSLGRCGAGVTSCAEGVSRCLAIAEPIPERCDGIDDDCDGVIDEALAPPIDLEALGVCQTPHGRCEQGRWVIDPVESLETYEAIEQRCDGLDNDCDGRVDEGVITTPCERDDALGPCALGVLRCVEGQPACVSEHRQSAELCNGVDDDCDGGVDEEVTLALYPQQHGVCVGLSELCEEGGVRAADPTRLTQYEDEELTCDGLDNDCDGVVDEGFVISACDTSEVGVCRAGFTRCDGGRAECVGALPGVERCNGLDDDCDGAVDEELIAPSTALTLGVCAGQVQLCRGEEGWRPPEAPLGYEEVEVSCDGLDNDCDGRIDEELLTPRDPNPLLKGVCLDQRLICAEGSLRAPNTDELTQYVADYEPTEASCDGLDNDCDGEVDERLPSTPCVTELSGDCELGVSICEDGASQCQPNVSPSAERCDGVDNDCDGITDEGLIAGECTSGVGGCLQAGIARCQAGSFVCDAVAGDPSDERCNGVDDDCDGSIDETFDLATLTCSVGVGACQRSGQWRCELGALSCDAVIGPSLDERCDGVDNDCDGAIDEDFLNLARPCVSGIGACEVRGFWRCSAAGDIQCSNGPLNPEVERCDGLDNDCDGASDEHITEERCDEIDNDCDGVVDESDTAEVCDRQDNDCDGVIDESPCAPCLESVEGCPQLNWSALPAGDYLMGGSRADEQPLVAVRLPRFELSDEVSVTQYQACVRSGFCTEAGVGGDCNAGRADRGEHPINCVSWLQAYDYAYWVGARLPSEAEWEYAARSAGLGSPTPWGGGVVSCDFALLRDETGYGCGLNETTPVRAPRHSEGVSAQGLWDVLGNVAEWVEDDYQDHYTEAVSEGRSYCDPGGCAAQGQKVYRGGGWRVSVDEVDNRRRFSGFYQLRSAELGFRVARFGP